MNNLNEDWSAGSSGNSLERQSSCEIELESVLRNHEPSHLVAPLRFAQASHSHGGGLGCQMGKAEWETGLARQRKWDKLLRQRDLLRAEICRGREHLRENQKGIALLRKQLEEWPSYDRVCGYNPLQEWIETLACKEHVQAFLPDWIKRREAQLRTLNQQLKDSARRNGLEHLL